MRECLQSSGYNSALVIMNFYKMSEDHYAQSYEVIFKLPSLSGTYIERHRPPAQPLAPGAPGGGPGVCLASPAGRTGTCGRRDGRMKHQRSELIYLKRVDSKNKLWKQELITLVTVNRGVRESS